MTYSQGDILLIPIPFTDLSTSKKRPVLVLSNSDYNKTADDLIVAAITSNLDDKPYIAIFKAVKAKILTIMNEDSSNR
ncbi:MAG: type II toxin-antitoxin system PemK/MazF family toxin [Firmicutes bacterium]|nr:type II toxin-antitoxin system PemK/MazF family toxin [Bacillota bacterium]